MSLEIEFRDDLHAMTSGGVYLEQNRTGTLKRMFKLDGCHVFTENQEGEILPATLINAKNNRRIGRFRGKSLKLGIAHSHDIFQEYHVLEVVNERPRSLLRSFRRAAKNFRDFRKKNRDR